MSIEVLSVFLSVHMDFYKSVHWTHTIHRVLQSIHRVFELSLCVFTLSLSLSLCLSRVLCKTKLPIKYAFLLFVSCFASACHSFQARIHCVEDARAKRVGQENESDCHGESPKYSCTCKVVQDVLGWGANDNGLCDKQITLNTLRQGYTTKTLHRQSHIVSASEGVGFLAYVHVAKDKKGKLDTKTRPCIFLRYDDDDFGYRLWNLVEKEVIWSRDNFHGRNDYCQLGEGEVRITFRSDMKEESTWSQNLVDQKPNANRGTMWAGQI